MTETLIEAEQYSEWRQYHATVFGLSREQDVDMLVTWSDLFRREGYTPEDLHEASAFLAMNEPPRFRSEHLAGLQSRLREKRRAARAKDQPPEDTMGTCTTCCGCGRVSVPGAGVLTAGGNRIPTDSLQTVAVLCHCALGKWFQDHQGGKVCMRTLADYEREFPRWRDKVKRDQELLRMQSEAAQEAENADRPKSLAASAFDLVIAKLKRKLRQPGEDE